MSLRDALRRAAAAPRKAYSCDRSVDELFAELYIAAKDDSASKEDYTRIPRFHYKLPPEDDLLQQKLREESRALFLQRRNSELLENDELEALWIRLDENKSPPARDKPMIDFKDFKRVGQECGPKFAQFFTAKVFNKLLQADDPYGQISIRFFFVYVMKKVWLHQTRVGLSLYDLAGQGYLREPDLECYVRELMPSLTQLQGLEKSFHQFYICTAVRKFFFFLDPLRTGKIKILDILSCPFLDDLLELRDDQLSKADQMSNWFSAPSALKVYGDYLNLDKNHNGMLSKDELACYGRGTLTNVFIEQLFQVCQTYDHDMDYKTYLDFVLALENRKEPQALQYLFRILDVKSQGYLDAFTLNYFFKAIQEQIAIHSQEPVNFEDVKDEIFDMVKPDDPCKITLQDLIRCGQGDVVVSILIDANGFWTHENREALVSDLCEEIEV